MIEALVVIAGGFLVGFYLSVQYSDHATALQSAVQLLIATVWVAAAVVTIYTGFYIGGAALLAAFSYFWFSNYREVRDSDLRKKTSGWDPFGFDPK